MTLCDMYYGMVGDMCMVWHGVICDNMVLPAWYDFTGYGTRYGTR